MKKKLIWVGPRESDILYSNINFMYFVTYNGDVKKSGYSYTNSIKTRINQYNNNTWNLPLFLQEKISPLLLDENVELMFYNPYQSYLLGNQFVSRTICMNDRNILNLIRNKFTMRNFAQKYIPVVPFVHFMGNELPKDSFIDNIDNTIVLQHVVSSGGYGTKKMSLEACKKYLQQKPSEESYILSPYIKNAIPINVHVVIFDDDCVVFPPSLQILEEKEEHFVYIGADFHTTFSEKSYKNIIEKSTLLAKQLGQIGYRGVCGIDYMLLDEDVLFLEVNARFQASTFLINKLLKEEELPTIHELNIMAFEHMRCPLKSFSKFSKPASFFTIMGEKEPCWYSDDDTKLPRIIAKIIRDGFSSGQKLTCDAYLFRAIVQRNISWINPDGYLQYAPNIKNDSFNWQKKILNKDILSMKIGLLNQGVRISSDAKDAMIINGTIRQGVFQSVDLHFPNGMVINTPYLTDFSELSPYCIDWNGDKYLLYYHKKILAEISFDTTDQYRNLIASQGTIYNHAAFWATDRLRIHHQFRCKFKEKGMGCKFCNIKLKQGSFTISDVYEIIDFYLKQTDFRHFLIGGGSGEESMESQNIINIAKYIRSQSDKPIYAMCLPPQNVSILSKYKEAGINEIGFNIEVFNRKIAEEIMPGKGKISLDTYKAAFTEAVKIWGNTGNVRSIMVVGLEPSNSLLAGVEWLCKQGVMPILSIFRPMKNIILHEALPPDNETLENIYFTLKNLTSQYGLFLGPLCTECQNNTLSLPVFSATATYMD